MSFLTGKTAIITGAGYAALENGKCGSIGYGIATAFAKEGANLVITGRNQQKLDQAKSKLEEQYNIKVLVISADISAGANNRTIVQQVIDQTIATFGRIDVLINAAQASASGVTLQDHSDSQFDLAIYSGLYATFRLFLQCDPRCTAARFAALFRKRGRSFWQAPFQIDRFCRIQCRRVSHWFLSSRRAHCGYASKRHFQSRYQ